MSNAAKDYSRGLDDARKQDMNLPSPGQFNVPKNGSPDNYNSGEAKHADNYSNENNHTDRLERARAGSGASEAKKAANLAGDVVGATTPMGAVSLLKQINAIGDMPYAVAIGAGMLKDLLDSVTFETIIIPIILGALYSIFTFMMVLLVQEKGKRKTPNVFLKKGLMIIAGALVGFIPGLNIIPEATSTALAVYISTLSERKHAKK